MVNNDRAHAVQEVSEQGRDEDVPASAEKRINDSEVGFTFMGKVDHHHDNGDVEDADDGSQHSDCSYQSSLEEICTLKVNNDGAGHSNISEEVINTVLEDMDRVTRGESPSTRAEQGNLPPGKMEDRQSKDPPLKTNVEADDAAIETQLLATIKEDNEFEGLGEEEPFYTGSYKDQHQICDGTNEASLFFSFNSQIDEGVGINDHTFIGPRKPITSVPYRRRSRDGGSPWWRYVRELVRRRKAKE